MIVHQLTAIPARLNVRQFDRAFAPTNRLRTEGTDHLLAAGQGVGARRLLAQSFAGWPYERKGGPIKTEEDPLDPNPPAALRRTLDARLDGEVSGRDAELEYARRWLGQE